MTDSVKPINYRCVSTMRQAAGHDLLRQETGFREYCEREGLTRTLRYEDVGSGTLDLVRWPVLGAAIDAIKHAECSVLVVEAIDRMARNFAVWSHV